MWGRRIAVSVVAQIHWCKFHPYSLQSARGPSVSRSSPPCCWMVPITERKCYMPSHGDGHNGTRQHINYPCPTLEYQAQEMRKNAILKWGICACVGIQLSQKMWYEDKHIETYKAAPQWCTFTSLKEPLLYFSYSPSSLDYFLHSYECMYVDDTVVTKHTLMSDTLHHNHHHLKH